MHSFLVRVRVLAMKKQLILATTLILVIAALVVGLTVAQSSRPKGAAPIVIPEASAPRPAAPSEPITLARAAAAGRLELVRERIDAGDQLDSLDEEFSLAALHHAANLERIDIARALLEAGADADVEDEFAKTPLHFVARNGNVQIAQLLLEHGATANVVETKFGFTPLHFAAIENHVGVAEALLQAGASYEIEDVDGARPSHYAQASGHQAIIDVIGRHHRLRNPEN